MDVNLLVQTIAIYALPVLFAITLHEAAHGYVARHFGDLTAHAQGRISLNPLRHVDPIGTMVVPLGILLVSFGNFVFGWAKPVPVNYSALRNPRRDMALVAAAGPAANLLMALLWAVALRVFVGVSDRSDGWLDLAEQHGIFRLVDAVIQQGRGASDFLIGVCAAGILVNLVFMLLNLLPIPPLDGGRIVTSLLPRRAAGTFVRLEPLGIPLLLLLLLVPIYGSNALSLILSPLLVESGALIRALVL
jgi:Zn-dependent protease